MAGLDVAHTDQATSEDGESGEEGLADGAEAGAEPAPEDGREEGRDPAGLRTGDDEDGVGGEEDLRPVLDRVSRLG